MYETLKMMSSVATREAMIMPLEKVAIAYRKEFSSYYIAAAFCNLFPMMLQISSQYYGLTSEDIASYALQKLDECLRRYEPDRTVKFSTYYFRVFKNVLREKTEALNTNKRKIFKEAESLDQLLAQAELSELGRPDNMFNHLEDIIDLSMLNEKEKRYCQLIISGYDNNREIAKQMKVSIMTLSNLRKSLRSKFQGAL